MRAAVSASGSVQGQFGWGSEQSGLVKDVPPHGRGLELDDPYGLLQPKLFYNSVINYTFLS